MRTPIKRTLMALLVGALSCASDGGDDTADSAADGATGGGPMCDPVGANPEMGALLNAALEADVEVIVKDPQHPGDPGPVGLP